jgi:hypothetical protein
MSFSRYSIIDDGSETGMVSIQTVTYHAGFKEEPETTEIARVFVDRKDHDKDSQVLQLFADAFKEIAEAYQKAADTTKEAGY